VTAPSRVAPGPRVFYGWVVLMASVAIIAVGTGTIFSLAVFLRPLEEDFGWTRSLISGVAFVNWVIFGVGSFIAGVVSDRIGARRVVAVGTALLGAALVASSQIRTAAQLYVAFGVIGALGASGLYVPLSATATRWFAARRGLAMGIISSGMGLGILVVPPTARALITALGWRAAFAAFGGLTWIVGGVALRYLVDRPEDRGLRGFGAELQPAGPRPAPAGGDMTAAAVLRHPAFWGVALVHFGCCAAHSGPIFHMVAHAMDLGVTKMAAASMLGLSGGTSIAGRLSSGVLADRFGARPALVGMLAIQALVLSFYLYAGAAVSLFVVALFFGVAYGGAMPLYALVAREFFGERVVGTTFGGIFFISCIGMGLGAYGGGFLYDHLGTYWSLHLASTLVAAGAVAVAMALRPPRVRVAVLAPSV
jgi:predicted MFS family arabinose efflux permease